MTIDRRALLKAGGLTALASVFPGCSRSEFGATGKPDLDVASCVQMGLHAVRSSGLDPANGRRHDRDVVYEG